MLNMVEYYDTIEYRDKIEDDDLFPYQTVDVVAVTSPLKWFEPEKTIAYCARVSSDNQDNPEYEKLLKYLKKHKHWSPFEMANVVLEIVTTRDIGRQLLRHQSLKFQELSQRYQEIDTDNFVMREARLQDHKNRQNSIENTDFSLDLWWYDQQAEIANQAAKVYNEALKRGIAKEQARVILPEGMTLSKLYVNANVRSLIHYCGLRMGNGTQLEHMDLANKIYKKVKDIFPVSMEDLEKDQDQ